ncbi:MAG: hypothetical protein M3Y39_12925 [Chloroflexota bacterium]|nr:hypothetical protein [Chloroflexota bacterium]
MKLLTWGYSKARIWLAELPDWKYEAVEMVEREQMAKEGEGTELSCAAVELFLPVGPRAYYGGLGAILVPESTGKLHVRVTVSSDKGQRFEEALTGTLDTVYKGLPREYGQGILEGIMQFNEVQTLGSGMLSFSYAVHGEISSSVWFFQLISRVVIRMLKGGTHVSSEEDVKGLLRLEIKQPHL